MFRIFPDSANDRTCETIRNSLQGTNLVVTLTYPISSLKLE